MIEVFSLEFWIAILFILNFILVIFLFLFVKKINRLNLGVPDQKRFYDDGNRDLKKVTGSARDIMALLEPLVKESRKTAICFDEQVKEKKRLLKELNDALDSRIISINLLLSRADALQKKLVKRENQFNLDASPPAAMDQQNQIIELYNQKFDIDSIAQRLSIPKGEIQLVIDLKKKFVAMEKKSR